MERIYGLVRSNAFLSRQDRRKLRDYDITAYEINRFRVYLARLELKIWQTENVEWWALGESCRHEDRLIKAETDFRELLGLPPTREPKQKVNYL